MKSITIPRTIADMNQEYLEKGTTFTFHSGKWCGVNGILPISRSKYTRRW